MSIDPIGANAHDTRYLNRYSYAVNNPNRYTDPTGEFFETAWDVFNAVLGFFTTVEDVKDGRYGDAAISAACAAADTAAAIVPGIPGGVSAGIKAKRLKDKTRANSSLDEASELDLPDDTLVCRGGECGAVNFEKGTDVTENADGTLENISVQVKPGATIEDWLNLIKITRWVLPQRVIFEMQAVE